MDKEMENWIQGFAAATKGRCVMIDNMLNGEPLLVLFIEYGRARILSKVEAEAEIILLDRTE